MASVPQPNDKSDFPAYWDWAEGTANGTYLRMDSGPTAFGTRAILVLEIAGVERAVWVTTDALRGKLADELRPRGARDFTAGEQITISRGAEKRASASDRLYWPFQVTFLDAPKTDAAALLSAEGNDEPFPPAADADDEFPF